MARPTIAPENLLSPAEVAALFRVDPKTVTRWAKAGKLTSVRTLGGHRRYKEEPGVELLHGHRTEPAVPGTLTPTSPPLTGRTIGV
jgi:excisionase family DNA binding protein